METFIGHIKTPQDALIIFEACRRGMLQRVKRRLSTKERMKVKSGSVFAFDESEAGMRRWTDGRTWSPSRVLGSFLTYRELDTKRRPRRLSTASGKSNHSGNNNNNDLTCSYKPNGLIKQSFSICTANNQKMHLISYYSKADVVRGHLTLPSADPNLGKIVIPKGLYPELNPLDTSGGHSATLHLLMKASIEERREQQEKEQQLLQQQQQQRQQRQQQYSRPPPSLSSSPLSTCSDDDLLSPSHTIVSFSPPHHYNHHHHQQQQQKHHSHPHNQHQHQQQQQQQKQEQQLQTEQNEQYHHHYQPASLSLPSISTMKSASSSPSSTSQTALPSKQTPIMVINSTQPFSLGSSLLPPIQEWKPYSLQPEDTRQLEALKTQLRI